MLFLVLFSSYSNPLFGQSTRPVTNVERRVETMNRQASDFERDNMGRDGKAKSNAETAKKTRQIRLEIEEDLKELQSAYNNIVTALNATRELRPGYAVTNAELLRKNALRLKANLVLPEADEDGEKAAALEPKTERDSLILLCRTIYDLITNPIFEEAHGLDVKHGSKAKRDLQKIIDLAERLLNNQPKTSKDVQ